MKQSLMHQWLNALLNEYLTDPDKFEGAWVLIDLWKQTRI